MIKKESDHFLWDVAVDQPAGEGVAPSRRAPSYSTVDVPEPTNLEVPVVFTDHVTGTVIGSG
jgi:hypothetical protein